MARIRKVPIPKFQFSEPVRNLPNHPTGCGGEDRFVLRFAQAYSDSLAKDGKSIGQDAAIVRQIPANGYGIADIVAATWDSPFLQGPLNAPGASLVEPNPVVYAFEAKLRDWRKALMQASRYRFFAHVTIVVLPEDASRTALKYLRTFHMLDVGLWTFDATSRRIITYFTPSPVPPKDIHCAESVLNRVARITKVLPIFGRFPLRQKVVADIL